MSLKTTFFSFFILFYSIEGIAQNAFKITGGTVKITDNTSIILKDCQLQNNGTLTATNGTVEIKGTATKSQSEIGGMGTSTFHNLKINKASNDVQLGSSITVNNQMELANGKLDLQTHTLTLGTTNGTLIGESETSHITATSTGRIIKTLDLNAPSSQNPGNLGIEITSAANLGSTEIRRRHNHQTVPTGTSIFRHFTITPTNNTALAASLNFKYLDAELNGIPENALVLMENNGGWMIDGFDNRNATNNTVSFSGYDGLYQYTLGANEADLDMDGIPIAMDNCPNDANADQADVDNDMVGDVCDACPNGDDMIDANSNNIIDDCECKTSSMNITGTNNEDSVYVAGSTIQSDAIIPISRKAIYKAETSITLSPGFHAVAGTEFLATITSCQTPALFNDTPTGRIYLANRQVANLTTLSAHPNPIHENAQIEFFVPNKTTITLTVQDIKGQLLTVLMHNELLDKGTYQLNWSPKKLGTGSYFLQLKTAQEIVTKKLMVFKD